MFLYVFTSPASAAESCATRRVVVFFPLCPPYLSLSLPISLSLSRPRRERVVRARTPPAVGVCSNVVPCACVRARPVSVSTRSSHTLHGAHLPRRRECGAPTEVTRRGMICIIVFFFSTLPSFSFRRPWGMTSSCAPASTTTTTTTVVKAINATPPPRRARVKFMLG